MAAYNWGRIMDMKTDSQLEEIIKETPDSLDSEAIISAEKEIQQRKEMQSFKVEPKFPAKPFQNEKRHSVKNSVISLILFVAAFYFIFKWDLKYVFILTGVLLIHELGHYLAMRIFKYNDLSIFFVPMLGAYVTGQKEEISQKQKIIISLAGPLPGVLIGSILITIAVVTRNEVLWKIGVIFLYLNLFNLLPIMPLDGGQIIKSLFFQNNEKINIVFTWLSIIVLALIALKLESYILLIIPFFLFMQIKNQTQIKNFKVYLKSKGFDINRDYKELSNEEYWLLRDEIAMNIKVISNLVEPQKYFPVPAENRVIYVMKQIVQKQPVTDLGIGGKILFLLLWIMTFIVPFTTGTILYIRRFLE